MDALTEWLNLRDARIQALRDYDLPGDLVMDYSSGSPGSRRPRRLISSAWRRSWPGVTTVPARARRPPGRLTGGVRS